MGRRLNRDLGRIHHLWKAFRRGEKVLPYLPSRVWMELTDHCNLQCPLCPNPSLPKAEKGFMTLDLFKKIIDQIYLEVYDLNLFHRGESLLHPQLIEMIGYARDKGVPCRIHTNATLLSTTLARKILESGLEFLSFSFDGFEATSYEKNRFPANFSKTLENITSFLKLKKESQKEKPITILQMMGLGPGEKDIRFKEFLRPLRKLGLNRVVFRQPHNWGGAVPLSEGGAGQRKRPSVCTFPWYALVVYWNGLAGPCPQDFFGQIQLGNLNASSVQEVWNGPPMQRLREQIARRDYDQQHPCQACDRPRRSTLWGVPREYLKTFVKENLLGYH